MKKEIAISKHEFSKRLQVAEEKLKSAKILLTKGYYRDSISRSYYSFFTAATTLLAIKGIVTKTHSGALQQFSLHFVKTKIISKEYGKRMRELLEERQQADYEFMVDFTKQEAVNAYNEAKEFLNLIQKDIGRFFEF